MIASSGESGENGFIKIWDANTGALIAKLEGHTDAVTCLVWTAQSTLISGSEDHSIRTWNTTTWEQIKVLSGHTDALFAIKISDNGRILASASRDKTVRLWDLENGQPIGSPLQHADISSCVSFSTNGKILTTGCNDGNAYSWDIDPIVREAGRDELFVSWPAFPISPPTEPPIIGQQEIIPRLRSTRHIYKSILLSLIVCIAGRSYPTSRA